MSFLDFLEPKNRLYQWKYQGYGYVWWNYFNRKHSKDSNFKATLWSSFGDIINKNIEKNLKDKFGDSSMLCEMCGKRVIKTRNRMYCDSCKKDIQKKVDRAYQKKKYHKEKFSSWFNSLIPLILSIKSIGSFSKLFSKNRW